MKKLVLTLFFPIILISSELEYKGNIGFLTEYSKTDAKDKRDNALALRLDAELKQEFGDVELFMKFKGIFDKDDKNRRYFDFNDFYLRYNFEDSDILIGRNTVFWGALEFYNLSDVFNTRDLLDDPFDFNLKLGAWNVAYTTYLENSEISLIVKLHEEKQKMQDSASINNFLPLPYNDNLITSEDKNRPTVFLKYSGSLDEMQADYSLIYQNGYDQQRYLSVQSGKLQQNAYIVNKLLGFATLVYGDTIYKTELAYALSDEVMVSDYFEFGVGFEHTLYGVWEKRDLGLLLEYYLYDEKDDDKVDFNKFFENDLTFGFRLSINDLSSSEVLGGVAIDMENSEKMLFLKYDTRVYEKYKLGLSYQRLDAKQRELDRVGLEFGYYF